MRYSKKMSGKRLLTTALPMKPKFEKDKPYVYIFWIYLSLVTAFETKIANGTAMSAMTELMTRICHAELILSMVKFSMNVPMTSAGMKTVFSSLDKTAAEPSGSILRPAKIKPIIIKPKRKAV